MHTCSEVHEESSTGSSWKEFFDRSSFMSSLDSQTSDGTALSPCPSRESSLKQEKHELRIKGKITSTLRLTASVRESKQSKMQQFY